MGRLNPQVLIGLQTLLESAPDAAVLIDHESKIALTNAKTETLFGYSPDDLVGQSFGTLVPECFRDNPLAQRLPLLASSIVRRMGNGTGLYGLRRDGTEFPVEMSLGSLKVEERRFVWATIVDVSERKEQDADLRSTLQEHEALLKQIREHEAFLWNLVDGIPSIIVCKDAQNDFRISFSNWRGRQVRFGAVGESDVGKTVYDLLPKALADAAMESDRRVIESGEVVRVPPQAFDTATGRVILQTTKIPIAAEGEQPRYVLGITEDISERQRYEGLRQMQLGVTRELAEATTFDQAVPTLLQRIAEGVDREMALLWWIDGASQTLKLRKGWSSTEMSTAFAQDSAGFSFERGVSLPGRVWETASSETIADVALDTNFSRLEKAKERNIRGAFGFPIMGKGGVVGVVEVFCHRVEAVSENLMIVLSDIGRQIGQFYDRTTTEEEMRRSQREFGDVLEKLPACIMIRRGNILVYANPATAAATGYDDATGLIGKSFLELVHPSFHDLFKQRVAGTQPPNAREMLVFRADGTTMLVEIAPEHIPVTFEGAPAFLISIRDITEQRLAQELLEKQAEQMKALSLTDDLTSLHNRRGFLTLGEQQLKMAARARQRAACGFGHV